MIKRYHITFGSDCWKWVLVAMFLLMPVSIGAGNSQNVDLDLIRSGLDQTITFRDKFYDATAIGKQIWIVGYYGTILHIDTEHSLVERQDGGTTLPLFDVSFVDRNIGYVVGKRGIVLKTTDGGKAWIRVKEEGKENLFSAHFISAETGWAVGDFGAIIQTTDGGKTWKNLSLQGADISFNGCYFLDAENGVVVGEFEGIFRTRDGGKTWQSVNKQNVEGVSLFGVNFKNSLEGIAVGQNGVVFRTMDGGNNWERTKMETDDNLLSIGVIDGQYNIVGLRGRIIETSSDGELTANENSRISDWLYCIVGLHSGAVIAAGDHGRVLWSDGKYAPRQWKILK